MTAQLRTHFGRHPLSQRATRRASTHILLFAAGLSLAALQASAAETGAEPATEQEETNELDKVVARAPSPLKILKDEPKSVSIVSGEELSKLSALNVTDILKRIGNVKWNYGNPKTGTLSIRGISAGSSEAIDPSLGVVVDGVPYAYVALASGADYVDIATVDVARGPQGSAGGKNTSMGTINIVTKQPASRLRRTPP